jgi:hypothetical protein
MLCGVAVVMTCLHYYRIRTTVSLQGANVSDVQFQLANNPTAPLFSNLDIARYSLNDFQSVSCCPSSISISKDGKPNRILFLPLNHKITISRGSAGFISFSGNSEYASSPSLQINEIKTPATGNVALSITSEINPNRTTWINQVSLNMNKSSDSEINILSRALRVDFSGCTVTGLDDPEILQSHSIVLGFRPESLIAIMPKNGRLSCTFTLNNSELAHFGLPLYQGARFINVRNLRFLRLRLLGDGSSVYDSSFVDSRTPLIYVGETNAAVDSPENLQTNESLFYDTNSVVELSNIKLHSQRDDYSDTRFGLDAKGELWQAPHKYRNLYVDHRKTALDYVWLYTPVGQIVTVLALLVGILSSMLSIQSWFLGASQEIKHSRTRYGYFQRPLRPNRKNRL